MRNEKKKKKETKKNQLHITALRILASILKVWLRASEAPVGIHARLHIKALLPQKLPFLQRVWQRQ